MAFGGPHSSSYNECPPWGCGPPPWITNRPGWSMVPGSEGIPTTASGVPASSASQPVPTMPLSPFNELAAVVDDDDVRIRYQGGWSSVVEASNWYRRTYHKSMPSEERLNISFAFKGYWVEIHGQRPIGSGAEFDCSLDPSEGTERVMGAWAYGPSNGSSTDTLPCTWAHLSPTVSYTINLWVSHPSSAPSDSFGLDYILYGPIESELRMGDTIRYHRRHNQIGYTGAVNTLGDWRYTIIGNGGGFNFSFHGSSAMPYVYLPSARDSYGISGVYDSSISGLQPPTVATSSTGAYIPLVFDMDDHRELDHHTLEVSYRPSNQSNMYLDFIEMAYVYSTSDPGTPTPTGTSPPTRNTSSGAKAAIIGGVIGGVFGLGFVVLFMWWLVHRRRNIRLQALAAEPFRPEADSIVSPTSGTVTEQLNHMGEKGGYGGGRHSIYPVIGRQEPDPEPEPAPTQLVQQTSPHLGAARTERMSASPRFRFLFHTDSGVRIPRMRRSEVVEVPPVYTPG